MKDYYLLAIETSCDDTSMAIFHGRKLLAMKIATSLKEQQKYGGIVPEVASRDHCKQIDVVCQDVCREANIQLQQITQIAYTAFPGLINSLHIGKVFAQQLASMLNCPILPINHLFGHIFSYFIDHEDGIKFPVLSLVVSGGHTFIAKLNSYEDIEILNQSCDDAVGEALDKIGRCLGLKYPGGISLDKIYSPGNIEQFIAHQTPSKNFSFSGIKSYVINKINHLNQKKIPIDQVKIGSSFLFWIVQDIIKKVKYYVSIYPSIDTILIGGGVSANNLLRQEMEKLPLRVLFPTKKFTNDNAAMIGIYAHFLYAKNKQ